MKIKLYYCKRCGRYRKVQTLSGYSDGAHIVSCSFCGGYITEYKWSKIKE